MSAICRLALRNFHDEATLSTEIAPETGYSIDNTQDDQRSRVWLSTGAADQYIAGTFDDGISRTVSFVGIFRHRCHGGSVRIRLYSDDNWTTQVYDSGVLSVNCITPTVGLDWSNGDIDPFVTDSPFRLWLPTPTNCLSYRIYFSSHSSAYGFDAWQVCRFVIGNSYELPYTAVLGHTLGIVDQTDRNRSRGGSLRTNIGPNWRAMALDVKRVPDADLGTWLDIMKYCGTGRSFVASLYADEGSRRERDHLMLAKFSSLDLLTRWDRAYTSKRIQIEEV